MSKTKSTTSLSILIQARKNFNHYIDGSCRCQKKYYEFWRQILWRWQMSLILQGVQGFLVRNTQMYFKVHTLKCLLLVWTVSLYLAICIYWCLLELKVLIHEWLCRWVCAWLEFSYFVEKVCLLFPVVRQMY